MDREIHPAANLFPMMSPHDLSDLTEDIRRNGLLEPIALLDGKVVDGRNRLTACVMAQIEPRFVDICINGSSPSVYVLSKNLHRRHLTVSQRAAIAAEAVPILEEEAKARMLAGRVAPVDARGKSAEIAARALQTSERSVERAIAVRKTDPELFDKIKSGEVTAYTAYEKIPKSPRPKAENKKSIGSQKADTQKRNMVTALSTMTGLCRGLEEINIRLALSLCDEAEAKMWGKKAREIANKIKKFALSLEETYAEHGEASQNG